MRFLSCLVVLVICVIALLCVRMFMLAKELCSCVLDQFFSKIAGWLKNHCAWDREALLNAAREGYQPWWTKRKPVGINLSTAANFSHWIKDYLTIFHNITDFQQFEITRIEEVTVVRARRHCGVPNAGWSSIGGERTDGYTPVSFCLYLSLSLGLSLSLHTKVFRFSGHYHLQKI